MLLSLAATSSAQYEQCGSHAECREGYYCNNGYDNPVTDGGSCAFPPLLTPSLQPTPRV